MAQKRYNEFVQGKHVTLDPFKTREYWGELREQLGNRVTTEIVRDADHALFPDQPDRVADVVVAWCQRLMIHETGKSENERLNLLVRRTRSNAKENANPVHKQRVGACTDSLSLATALRFQPKSI